MSNTDENLDQNGFAHSDSDVAITGATGNDGAPIEAPLEAAAPDVTAKGNGDVAEAQEGGAESESASVDTFGLPNAAAPSLSGGIADDAATIDVSHMTDDFAGVASQAAEAEDPPRG
eukprot:scaffold26963_cov155-Skeletonema_dohrnii-CCMP3373.AAC.1